jgi:lipopolysaccharide export system permease protein
MMYNGFKMRILNRYLIKEFFPPFFFGAFLFTFILLMDKMIYLNKLLVKGVNIFTVSLLLIYYLPAIFAVTVPIGFLTGTLMVFGRLSMDNEITAMKASGISLYRLLLPMLLLSLIFSLLAFLIIDMLLPQANYAFKNLYYRLVSKSPTLELEERVFLDIGNHRVYIEKIKKAKGRKPLLQGIIIYQMQEESLPRIIIAREGKWVVDPDKSKITLKLFRGTIHELDKENPDQYQELKFEAHDLDLKIAQDFNPGKVSVSAREMSMKELRGRIEEYKKRRIKVNSLLVELYKKVSIPSACLVFALIGVPLGTFTRRGGRGIGFIMSLVLVFFIYYPLLAVGEMMGKKDILPPLFSVWLPNIVLGAIGIFLLFRLMKR